MGGSVRNLMTWEIIDTGRSSAETNMRIDGDLLESLKERKRPILHFYDWAAESLTYGHFVKPEQFLDLALAKTYEIEWARRPTGGGIVFHVWDFAFSILVPASDFRFSQNTLENYAFVNQTVLKAVQKVFDPKGDLELIKEDGHANDPSCQHFCMAKPTKYDVLFKGKKIIGAAQRKTKSGFLHQGTISLMMPDRQVLEEILLPGPKLLEAMFATTFPLLGEKGTKKELFEARKALRDALENELI